MSTLGRLSFLHSAFPPLPCSSASTPNNFVDAADAWLDAATQPIRRAVHIGAAPEPRR